MLRVWFVLVSSRSDGEGLVLDGARMVLCDSNAAVKTRLSSYSSNLLNMWAGWCREETGFFALRERVRGSMYVHESRKDRKLNTCEDKLSSNQSWQSTIYCVVLQQLSRWRGTWRNELRQRKSGGWRRAAKTVGSVASRDKRKQDCNAFDMRR